MNALSDRRVADYVRAHCVATYQKVGTFQVIGNQKVGGNVASYFCLADGSVLHAVPGPVTANGFLKEARWAVETRKGARTASTDLVTGKVDPQKYRAHVLLAHEERYAAESQPWRQDLLIRPVGGMHHDHVPLPGELPRHEPRQAQAHWLLATNPLDSLERVYPFVWQQILNERLSNLPVIRE